MIREGLEGVLMDRAWATMSLYFLEFTSCPIFTKILPINTHPFCIYIGIVLQSRFIYPCEFPSI
jgi:hypothetical protein